MLKEIIAPIAGRIPEPLSYSKGWERVVITRPRLSQTSDYILVNEDINIDHFYIANPNKWQTPAEFYERGEGDCKDFAVTKFYKLNLPKYIAVGGVANNQPHAVCVVYAPDREEWVVLDNRNDEILSWQEFLKEFTPVYLCDEEGVYL